MCNLHDNPPVRATPSWLLVKFLLPPALLTFLSYLLLGGSITISIWTSLFTLMIFRAITAQSQLLEKLHPQAASEEDKSHLDRISNQKKDLAERLAGAIRIPTVSYDANDDIKTDTSQFSQLHQHLQECFPLVHRHLKREVVNSYSLLFHWEGSDASLQPYLLMAHQDVVPVPPAELADWKFPPFSGTIAEDCVWGRGAIDDKHALMGILEAIEGLLKQGYRPVRSVYLAFGHDEEVSGNQGAANVAALLKARGVKFEFILDEGLFIIDKLLPLHQPPVAVICTAEKGFVNVKLKVKGTAGHSSIPPKESAIGILAKALSKLDGYPFPPNMSFGPQRDMLVSLAGTFAWPMRVIVSNMWLFAPLMEWVMVSLSPQTAAVLRTTSAATVVRGGDKANVMPAEATAIVNHRLHLTHDLDSICRADAAIIGDKRVSIQCEGRDPSPISPTNHWSFRMIGSCVAKFAPHAAVAPGLMIGGTDTTHFLELSSHVYRFNPIQLTKDETAMFHGKNERITVNNYINLIYFYTSLVRSVDQL